MISQAQQNAERSPYNFMADIPRFGLIVTF
jgi:hypothetical protein